MCRPGKDPLHLEHSAAVGRRSRSLDALLPVLYLRGVSTGYFQEALTALLGVDAPNLSPGAVTQLTAGWQEE